jgi:broad specificity phosphatase PhoE
MPPQFIFMQNGAENNLKSTDKLEDAHIEGVLEATVALGVKHFKAAYCSPLYSSLHTGALVSDLCKIDNIYAVDYLIDRQNLGLERASNSVIAADWPNVDITCLDAEPDVWTLHEPLKFVENRVILFLRKLVTQYENSDDNILIITHHDVLFCLFTGLSFSPCETICLDCDELKELL